MKMDQKILNILKAALKSHELLNDDRFSNIVIFTTQRDNKVDDFICLPLAGNEYGIDDPNRPRIPEDTHPNCRCYYVHKSTHEIVTDISSPRTYEHEKQPSPIRSKEIVRKLKVPKPLVKRRREKWFTNFLEILSKWIKQI